MIVATPFDEGFIIAGPSAREGKGLPHGVGRELSGQSSIAKVVWGLALSAGRPLTGEVRRRLAHVPWPRPDAIASVLEEADAVPALITVEWDSAGMERAGGIGGDAGEPNSPVAGFFVAASADRLRGVPAVRRVVRGGLFALPGDSPTGVGEAGLALQELLERGTNGDVRLAAVLEAFGHLGDVQADLGPDVDVGIHEQGNRFSVDRVSWRAQRDSG